ncbi:MAG: GNAT family N-acetyltransferase [Planctomycetes bacterium]|nr:GNAT family N-acetyltransferase [Planctomycetota bacterium]
MIRYETSLSGVDWKQAAEVFQRAPLGTREPGKLARAFANSYACVVAWDDDRLIGLARALCDGEYQAAIYDVVLLPEYQGKGIGKKMMEGLCEQLPVQNIILYAVPGRESFYRKCGFRPMLTAMAVLSPGMADPNAGYLGEGGPSKAPT